MSRREKRKKEFWFWENGKNDLRPASQSIPSGYKMEIEKTGRQTKIFFSRADKILKYDEEEIRLRVGRGEARVIGKELILSVFRAGTVEISGRVDGVLFGGESDAAFA